MTVDELRKNWKNMSTEELQEALAEIRKKRSYVGRTIAKERKVTGTKRPRKEVPVEDLLDL